MLPLQKYIERGPFDDLNTPVEALQYLLPYLPYRGIVWEACPGPGILVGHLKSAGYQVVDWTGDFLLDDPPERWDLMITNPPYSKKHLFLKRCSELNKPYAILLPVTSLGVKRCQQYLTDCGVVFLPKRIDFTGKKAPWFAVCWIVKGLGIDGRLTFAE